jgi:hypothetical protein
MREKMNLPSPRVEVITIAGEGITRWTWEGGVKASLILVLSKGEFGFEISSGVPQRLQRVGLLDVGEVVKGFYQIFGERGQEPSTQTNQLKGTDHA